MLFVACVLACCVHAVALGATLEPLLKPCVALHASLPDFQSPCGGVVFPACPWVTLVEKLAHVTVWRPAAVQEGGLEFPTGSLPCRTPWGLARCSRYTPEQLQETYDMDTTSPLELEEHQLLVVADLPQPVRSSPALSISDAGCPAAHEQLAEKALQFRRGQNPYAGCNQLCGPSQGGHRHNLQLDWILAPLWGEGGTPQSVSFINLGCRDFGPDDPVATLLGTGAPVTGLCVDADEASLRQAREMLREHGGVTTIAAFLTPSAIRVLLLEHWPSAEVDVLKVDIDSFDVDVLSAALAVVKAAVVIVEFEFMIPPPFLWARHYAGEGELTWDPMKGNREGYLYGASLAYYVQVLETMGYDLYKMNHNDAVFVHHETEDLFTKAEAGRLTFPVDEWACFLSQPFSRDDDDNKVAWRTVQDWLLGDAVEETLRHVWTNISHLSRPPWTLDLSPPRVPDSDRSR